MDKISLNYGFGGRDTNILINNYIFDILYSDRKNINGNDGAVFDGFGRTAVSTDSFVVSPLFFYDKSIGNLCVAGSVNDVLACGAVPKYLTLSFIIEEDFALNDFEKILYDIKEEADRNNVLVVTGDTKVVPKGNCDGIYINTACVGEVIKECNPKNIEIGDKIILTGTVGDHEAALTVLRNNLPFKSEIKSDVNGLAPMIVPLLKSGFNIKAMRDPTRGGLAATLNELSEASGRSFLIEEKEIPVKNEVKAFCSVTGLDKFIFASEGKMLVFVSDEESRDVLEFLKQYELGKDAKIIGSAVSDIKYSLSLPASDFTEIKGSPIESRNRVYLKTLVRNRVLPMPNGSQLPRIC